MSDTNAHAPKEQTFLEWLVALIDRSVNQRLTPIRKTVKSNMDGIALLNKEVDALKARPLLDPSMLGSAEKQLQELDRKAVEETERELNPTETQKT
jgi:hypothetical protein